MGHQIAPSTASDGGQRQFDVISSTGSNNDQSKEDQKKEAVIRTPAIATSKVSHAQKYTPRMFDVWALGVNAVLGGQFYGWNEGMKAGFGSYAIGQSLVGFAYINLTFSLAEICSTLSFSGGAYGMTRVVLGFYVGFLVAAFELMEYITYTSAAAIFIAQFLCDELGWHTNYIPLLCLTFYICMMALILEGNHIFWRMNQLVAIGIVIIMIWYILGSLQFTNFDRYACFQEGDNVNNANNDETKKDQYWFVGGMTSFLTAMPLMTWGFGGIESIALVTDIIENPRKNVSYGISATVITLFVLMISVMFVASALPSGLYDTSEMTYYMDSGFMLMGLSSSAAHWLILPAQIAMGATFLLPASKLYYVISESHLVPPWLQVHQQHHSQHQSATATATGGAISSNHITTTNDNNDHNTNTNSKLHHQNNQDDEISWPSGIHEIKLITTNEYHTYAIVYICLISYVFCLIQFFVPNFTMDNIPILLAQFTYFSDLYAYYELKQVFHTSSNSSVLPFSSNTNASISISSNSSEEKKNTTTSFSNPFGIIGAFISVIIFVFIAISVSFYQGNDYHELLFLIGYVAVLSVYYFLYAKDHQVFSAEEQKKLLSLHVITNNRRKKKKNNHHHQPHQKQAKSKFSFCCAFFSASSTTTITAAAAGHNNNSTTNSKLPPTSSISRGVGVLSNVTSQQPLHHHTSHELV